MISRWRLSALLLIVVAGIAACGQKGPLFLPGNPSQMTPPPAAEDEANEEQEDEDAEQRG